MVSSNLRIRTCDDCCKRWFVTFDGKECEAVPIDGILYMLKGTGNREKNHHRPEVITGHCKISKIGQIKVGFNVGNCSGDYTNGDQSTGWNSATRIYIKEVEAPQSESEFFDKK